jgi:hypothetical protein
MTYKEADKLKTGDRLQWGDDLSDLGTVVFEGAKYIETKWDNGTKGITDNRDMAAIGRVKGTES